MNLFKSLKTTQGDTFLVDILDLPLVEKYTWRTQRPKNKRTYYIVSQGRFDGKFKGVQLHRLIMKSEKGQIVDHKNHCGWDNRRSNLRFVNNSQNVINSTYQHGSTSKYKGVSYVQRDKRFSVMIGWENRMVTIGGFRDEELAGMAYDYAARLLFGEFAVLNFPDKPVVHLSMLRSINRKKSWISKSGYFGVRKVKFMYEASIDVEGVYNYLGVFDSPEDAAIIFDKKAIDVRGYKVLLNFPENLTSQQLLLLDKSFLEYAISCPKIRHQQKQGDNLEQI